MRHIGNFFSLVIVGLLLLWFAAIAMATGPCQKIARSSLPVEYTMVAVESLAEHWISDEWKLRLLLWRVNGSLGVQNIYRRTFYGEGVECQ